MIKFIGLYAASISTLLAYLSMSIYRFVDVQKYIKIRLDKRFIIMSILIFSIVIFSYYIRNIYLSLLIWKITFIIMIYIIENY